MIGIKVVTIKGCSMLLCYIFLFYNCIFPKYPEQIAFSTVNNQTLTYLLLDRFIFYYNMKFNLCWKYHEFARFYSSYYSSLNIGRRGRNVAINTIV